MTQIRKGQAPAPLTRAEFGERFRVNFYDPAFGTERAAIERLEAIAWDAHQGGRKAPITKPAGRGFADPRYAVSVEWLDARQRLKAAQKRWPKHVAGRVYGVVVHGDVAGVEPHRSNLSDWLEWMGLIDAGAAAKLDRYIGYYEPYYNSHDALDQGPAVQEEVRNVARSVAAAVKALRAGKLAQPDRNIKWPRPK